MPLALVSTLAVHAGEPKWIALHNQHFNVYSSAGERTTKAMLGQFERVRGFFVEVTHTKDDQVAPVSVLIFGTPKEYQPYRLNGFATAYYSNQYDRDFIVVGDADDERALTASHEFTHLVMQHAGFKLPPWLNEGIADLFSTLHAVGEETVFGSPLPGRLWSTYRGAWYPLADILAADQNSPYYNDADKADGFYAESWALVHMLATTREYMPKFWDVVRAIDQGMPSAQALEAAYGMPLAKIEDLLKYYVHGDRFNELRVRIPLERVDNLPSAPAELADVHELQAEVLMGLKGRRDEARARLEELRSQDPAKPSPWANLGFLDWRDGKREEAEADFDKAFDLGGRSPRMLMELAMLAQSERKERACEALRALLEVNPGDTDARLFLGNLLMARHQVAEAVAATKSITAVKTASQRDQLLYLRALAALQLGEKAAAISNAEQLRDKTDSDSMRENAAQVIRAAGQP